MTGQSLLVLAGLAYLFSHLLRGLRLYLLAFERRQMALGLVAVHFSTAWINVLLPFKLGEIVRLVSFTAVTPQRVHGPAIWFIERLSDAIMLIALIGISTTIWTLPPLVQWFLLLLIFFSVASILSIWAISELSAYLYTHLMLRSRSKRGLRLLKLIILYRKIADEVLALIIGRLASVIAVSAAIWSFEIISVALLASSFPPAKDYMFALVQSLTGQLSISSGYETIIFASMTVLGLILLLMVFLRSRHDK